MVVIAAILEALVRLRSRDTDSLAEAQRAIATARAEQLNESAKILPQLIALILFADVACSLSPLDLASVTGKIKKMQEYLDEIIEINTWSRDGTFAVPITRAAQPDLTGETGGIFIKDAQGRDCIAFSWLGRPDVYLIGFLLSGEALYSRNVRDSRAEKFLLEGLKMTEGNRFSKSAPKVRLSLLMRGHTDNYQFPEAPTDLPLARASARGEFRLTLKCYLLLHQTLCYCERSAWKQMQASLQNFFDTLQNPKSRPSHDLILFSVYLKAITSHASGDLDAALRAYQDPALALPASSKLFSSTTHETLAVLATLNSLFILYPPNHPEHSKGVSLLAQLEQYFPRSDNFLQSPISPTTQPASNSRLASAHHLHVALQSASLIATKKHLKIALDMSKDASSAQIRALVLTYLASAFFAGQTGEDARHHVLGARRAAQEAGSKLWTAAADGLVKDVLEREGRWEEVQKLTAEGENLVAGLGDGVKAFLASENSAGVNKA